MPQEDLLHQDDGKAYPVLSKMIFLTYLFNSVTLSFEIEGDSFAAICSDGIERVDPLSR